jgi:hypothetical protein
MRGCQIIRPGISKQALIERETAPHDHGKQYASFLTLDWKNRVVREISCAPAATVNYFNESNLPFEIMPAFFRQEVLVKYKADPHKYRMTQRSISCRGSWTAGQVHAYLIDLRGLPFEEQLYWRAYNERPKAPISERAYETDFEDSWDLAYDPLD